MPKGLAKDRALDELNAAKAAWRTADCKSCAEFEFKSGDVLIFCLLYTSPSPRD